MDSLLNSFIFEDSSDDDANYTEKKRKVFKPRINSLDLWNEMEFISRYRVSKKVALLLTRQIENEIKFVIEKSTMTKSVGTLYKMDASPPARSVLMVADLLGINLHGQDLNPLFREQDAPEIVKKNPMRTIPIYEEDDFCLADSHAIVLYLFDKYGKPEHSYLYPADKRKRAIVNQRLFFNCGVLFPRLRSIMAMTYRGMLTKLTKSMIRNTEEAYGMVEMYLDDTKYLADDVITLADISVLTTMSTLHGLHPIDKMKYPKVLNWYLDMSEQDFSKRINQPGADLHVEGLKAFMAHNQTNQKSKL